MKSVARASATPISTVIWKAVIVNATARFPSTLKVFKPAFLGRMIVVPYYPIGDTALRQIIELQLGRIRSRLQENNRVRFSYDEALVSEVARRCTEVESGARNVDHILTRSLLPEISREFLARLAAGEAIQQVHVKVGHRPSNQYEQRHAPGRHLPDPTVRRRAHGPTPTVTVAAELSVNG